MKAWARLEFWWGGPLVAAYALQGAKTPVSFLPLFLMVLIMVMMTARRSQLRMPPRLLLPFGLFLLWSWTALVNRAPLDTFLFFWCKALLYLTVGILFYIKTSSGTQKYFQQVVIILGGVETMLVIYGQCVSGDPQTAGLLRNSLHSGILIPIAFALSLVEAAAGRSIKTKTLWWIVAGVMAVAVFFLRSRSGLIAIAVLLLLRYPRKFLWAALGGAALAVLAFLFRAEFVSSYLEIDAFNRSSTFGRLIIWSTALDAIRSQPLFGWGLGNFETAYYQFQHPSGHLLRYSYTTMFAHNGLLQTAAETGLPGALLLFWGLTRIIKKSSAIKNRTAPLTGIIVVFFITGLFNYTLMLPFNALIFSATMGLLARKGEPVLEPSVPPTSWRNFAVTGLCGIPLVLFLSSFAFAEAMLRRNNPAAAVQACPIRSDAWYALALQRLRAGDDVTILLNRALFWNSRNAFYWQRGALVAAVQNTPPSEVIAYFEQAAALAPYHAPFYVQQGFYWIEQQQLNRAKILFEKAIELEPATPLPRFGLSLAEGNKKDAAQEQMMLARQLQQRLMTLQNDPQQGASYRELLDTEYARYLTTLPL